MSCKKLSKSSIKSYKILKTCEATPQPGLVALHNLPNSGEKVPCRKRWSSLLPKHTNCKEKLPAHLELLRIKTRNNRLEPTCHALALLPCFYKITNMSCLHKKAVVRWSPGADKDAVGIQCDTPPLTVPQRQSWATWTRVVQNRTARHHRYRENDHWPITANTICKTAIVYLRYSLAASMRIKAASNWKQGVLFCWVPLTPWLKPVQSRPRSVAKNAPRSSADPPLITSTCRVRRGKVPWPVGSGTPGLRRCSGRTACRDAPHCAGCKSCE